LRRNLSTLLGVCLTLLIGACGGDQSDPGVVTTTSPNDSATTTSVALDSTTTGLADGVAGLFDVGNGINLYLECEGTGTPTIVYMHGSIDRPGFSATRSSSAIRSSLGGQYRFCSYERRNVGRSDEVDGYFTGMTAVEDLHALMAAAEIEPPYVLLGASFGGLLAHLYSASYPDDVVGIVSLDGSFPGDITLDPLLPEDMRYDPDEDRDTLEKLSHYAALHEALELSPPDVPFHYLLAMPTDWPTLGVPAYDDKILDVLAEYVASYPQGTMTEVESPHYMEPAVPDIIAEHLNQVIEEAGM
jgi:pimeloyl-ACP methyl ester carboxylesterase